MGKLEGKTAVITAATSGMALATAKLFVEEGAYVFITGRRKEKLDEAVKLIGKNVTGVQGDAANLADLDRLYETVKRERGKIDILFASAGQGELPRSNRSPKSTSIRRSTSTCAARSSRCRKRCRSSTTAAPSSSTAPSPASKASRHLASIAPAKPRYAPSRAPGLSSLRSEEFA